MLHFLLKLAFADWVNKMGRLGCNRPILFIVSLLYYFFLDLYLDC